MGPSSLGRSRCGTSSKRAGLEKCSRVLSVATFYESGDFHR